MKCPANLLLAGVLLFLPTTAQSAAPSPSVRDIGHTKQCFIDSSLVDSSRGVSLNMNSPRRDGHPLIVPDQPWEKDSHFSAYPSVLKDGGKVRLWYGLLHMTGPGPYDHDWRVCYAESDDGLHFTKPILNLHEVAGSKANNVVLPGPIGGCSVWIDPKAPPEHRYKTQAKAYPTGQFQMHSSPDGLHWNPFELLNPGSGGWDTQSIIFRDAKIGRYVLFTRRWVRLQPRERSYRTVRRLESDDLKGWDNKSVALEADKIDLATHTTSTGQPPVDYYGAAVFPYEDTYIMLAQAFWHWQDRPGQLRDALPMHVERQPGPRIPAVSAGIRDESRSLAASASRKGLGPSAFDVRLLVSRDGKQFQRVGQRKPFMAIGPEGAFDSRFVWVAPNPVRMGDELWIYYFGDNRDHDSNIDPLAGGQHRTGIGRAVLRLDGFVSADADYTGGELTTPPLRFSGKRLELNLDTSGGGSAEAEVLDADGKPLAGFARADAIAINGNSVRMPVRWRNGDDVSPLAGKPVRLRFHLRDCKLYAFQFRE